MLSVNMIVSQPDAPSPLTALLLAHVSWCTELRLSCAAAATRTLSVA